MSFMSMNHEFLYTVRWLTLPKNCAVIIKKKRPCLSQCSDSLYAHAKHSVSFYTFFTIFLWQITVVGNHSQVQIKRREVSFWVCLFTRFLYISVLLLWWRKRKLQKGSAIFDFILFFVILELSFYILYIFFFLFCIFIYLFISWCIFLHIAYYFCR